ncbi:hypothetical protein CFE90_01615 [Listeria monocytogenes]|uniref:hypothetical protein n=1 Tax=Listeria monocytogenes TaxID=1639 RepID=UPI000BDFB1FE|nr:hypothetical protein [Listeria monocytogenes]EAC3096119.1 hypothetical protein [Listeria monocytogenes]EAC4148475.1 hypothetical protein [Listeria monocytogenes]EAC7138663.1 hypothetical protein [Listeria monocytogenes]EAD2460005.1 hypothetical protein [Listeria monocytogenes]EAD3338700.1 hypothetical protein [Listeria monocytogenes]
MIDKLKAELLESRRNLEKNLIGMFVASQTHATSENRKRDKIADIKSNCQGYIDGLSTTAEGKWVNQAKKSFKENANKFDNC